MFHNIDEAYWTLTEGQALCLVLCLPQSIYFTPYKAGIVIILILQQGDWSPGR